MKKQNPYANEEVLERDLEGDGINCNEQGELENKPEETEGPQVTVYHKENKAAKIAFYTVVSLLTAGICTVAFAALAAWLDKDEDE